MPKKDNLFFPITLFFFYLIEILLLKVNQYQLAIIVYFLFILFIINKDKKYIISFLVFSLPLSPIIPTDYKLFSFIGPHEIIYGFSFFLLLRFVRNKKIELNKYQKLSIKFIYFLFFLQLYIIIKDFIFQVNFKENGFFVLFIKRFIRYFLYYGSLVLLIKVIYYKSFLDYVLEGMKYSVVVITTSMYFSRFLILIGSSISFNEGRRDRLLSGDYTRYIGFYGAGGDENSAGIFLVGILGFFLALYEKERNNKSYFIFMGFAIFGILMTGSRTAFLAMLLISFIFFAVNKRGSIRIRILSAIVLFYYFFYERLNLVIQRFMDPSARAAIDPDETGRVGKWIIYSEWILNHPITFLFGNQELISFNRAPHNYFIYIIYHAGLIWLIIFLVLLIQLIKIVSIENKKYMLRNVYYILPFFLIVMTVNSFGSSIYLWLYLSIGALFIKTYNNKNENSILHR